MCNEQGKRLSDNHHNGDHKHEQSTWYCAELWLSTDPKLSSANLPSALRIVEGTEGEWESFRCDTGLLSLLAAAAASLSLMERKRRLLIDNIGASSHQCITSKLCKHAPGYTAVVWSGCCPGDGGRAVWGSHL